MKLLKQLRDWIFPVSEQQFLNQVINKSWSQNTYSGLVITPEGNLQVPAIWAGLSCIANHMCSMKFPVLKKTGKSKSIDTEHKVHDLLNFRANPEVTGLNFRRTICLHYGLFGNAYAEIVRDKSTGELLELWNLDPQTVKPEYKANGDLYYNVRGKRFKPEDILHVSCMGYDGIVGYSMAQIGREAIGLTKATEIYGSSFFGNGAQPGGFVKTEKKLDGEAVNALEAELNRDNQGLGNSHRIKVLQPGQDWVLTSVPPETAQFLLTRQFQLGEIARVLNIDPVRLGVGPKPTDMEAYNTDFYQSTLQPLAENIEAEFNSKLFADFERKAGWYCEHSFATLLRGNSAARASYYNTMYSLGAVTTNFIIEVENLGDNIGPAGDLHMIPANNLKSLESIYQELINPVVDEEKPAEPAPEAEKPTPNEATIEAARSVVCEALSRLVRREGEAISRLTNKPIEERSLAIEQFYSKQEVIVKETITPSVNLFVICSGSDEDPKQLIDQITRELTTESKSAVIASEAVEQLLKTWSETKARDIAAML